MSQKVSYLPALRFRVLTPLFDLVVRWGMRELTIKRYLVQHAQIGSRSRVLDLGSGTGTLAILAHTMHPDAELIGIDVDPDILAIARAKAAREKAGIRFNQGMAFSLPYDSRSFDRVVSSLVFHHLTTRDKERTLAEVRRVLNPGGLVLILDFGKPQNALAWLIGQVLQRIEPSGDLQRGVLPALMEQAGFIQVEVVARFMTAFGTVALYRGQKLNSEFVQSIPVSAHLFANRIPQ